MTFLPKTKVSGKMNFRIYYIVSLNQILGRFSKSYGITFSLITKVVGEKLYFYMNDDFGNSLIQQYEEKCCPNFDFTLANIRQNMYTQILILYYVLKII